jgi:hypothetical protein
MRLLIFQLLASLAAWGALGFWFLRPWLAGKPVDTALAILLVPQLFRHVGVTLLVEEVVDPGFPFEMARQVAIGDTLAAVLAWTALVALRRGWRRARSLVWLFSVVGFTDMLVNLANGVRFQVADQLGAAWFGIAFVVPLMLVSHVLIFVFLTGGRSAAAGGARAA